MSDNIHKLDSDYEDILAQRREGSDLRWAAREWEEIVTYKFRKKLKTETTYLQILRSERVNHTINKLVANGQSRKTVEKNVAYILDDMCHTLDIGMIRKFAITLPKIMKRIYNKILVNTSGIEGVKRATEDAPIILLPTHRSYADFLLISYITFHYNLPIPVIAAGMDFMSMVVIGDMLRGAGAFYIRRSFMDDSLYWAVFQEYVQNLLCDSGQPMEFFLEGTRSRSGKSLPPKLGLLGCVLECWLRAKIPDITIIPISISYNRTLEEKLYAYEMLGVPKPKESTSGLLKAMKILKENFGNIYIHFGKGISVSEYLSPSVDRHLSVEPFYLTSLTSKEFTACEALSLHVSRVLQNNCVVSIWTLACAGLLRALWSGLWSLPLDALCNETKVLARLAKKMGAQVEGLDSRETVEDHLKRSLKEHCEVVTYDTSDDGLLHIQRIHKENAVSKKSKFKEISFSSLTIESSVIHLLLQYYVNQILHLFIRPILISLIIRNLPKKEFTFDQIQEKYLLLSTIFSFDFIFEHQHMRKDIEEALLFLEEENCIKKRGSHYSVVLTEAGGGVGSHFLLMDYFVDIIKPFLLNYQVALKVVETKSIWYDESTLVSAIQGDCEAPASVHCLYSSMSLDTCRQAVKVLIKLGALSKGKSSNGNTELFPVTNKIAFLKESLKPNLLSQNLASKL